MSATAAVWKRELNSKHIWPFSLSVRNDWDGYNCVCNPICIEYHATSSSLSHSHTHTHTRDSISPHEFDPSQFLIYSFFGGVLFECCYHLCGEIQFNLDVVTIVNKHVNRDWGDAILHARTASRWLEHFDNQAIGTFSLWVDNSVPHVEQRSQMKKSKSCVSPHLFFCFKSFVSWPGLHSIRLQPIKKSGRTFFDSFFSPKAYYSARPTEFKFEFSVRVVGF